MSAREQTGCAAAAAQHKHTVPRARSTIGTGDVPARRAPRRAGFRVGGDMQHSGYCARAARPAPDGRAWRRSARPAAGSRRRRAGRRAGCASGRRCSPSCTLRPSRAGRRRCFRPSSAWRFRACRASKRRCRRAPENRMVSCGSHSSRARAAASRSMTDTPRGRVLRAIDLLGRLSGGDDVGAVVRARCDVEAVAARHAAAGVDHHRLARAALRGKRDAQAAGFGELDRFGATAADAKRQRTAAAGAHVRREDVRAGRARSQAAVAAADRRSDRETTPDIRLDHGRLLSRHARPAPRSITAKSSHRSRANSKYCSTSRIAMSPLLAQDIRWRGRCP